MMEMFLIFPGGGFGGKETRTAFLTNAAALAAQKLVLLSTHTHTHTHTLCTLCVPMYAVSQFLVVSW